MIDVSQVALPEGWEIVSVKSRYDWTSYLMWPLSFLGDPVSLSPPDRVYDLRRKEDGKTWTLRLPIDHDSHAVESAIGLAYGKAEPS